MHKSKARALRVPGVSGADDHYAKLLCSRFVRWCCRFRRHFLRLRPAHNRRFSAHPSVRCPLTPQMVNAYFAWRDSSLLNGDISSKLVTNIPHVNRHCRKEKKVFKARSQKSRSWPMTGPINLWWRSLAQAYIRRCGVEAQLLFI